MTYAPGSTDALSHGDELTRRRAFRDLDVLVGNDEAGLVCLVRDSQLLSLDDKVLHDDVAVACMDGQGCIAVVAGELESSANILTDANTASDRAKLCLYNSIDSLHAGEVPSIFRLPAGYEARAISSGASHLLISTEPPALFSYGSDNRFGQLGREQAVKSEASLERVDFFDDMEITQIA